MPAAWGSNGRDAAALTKSALPTILVATKCDNPEEFRQINADGMANAFPSVVADFKTSANVPGSTRDCLQAIISATMSSRRGERPARLRRIRVVLLQPVP